MALIIFTVTNTVTEQVYVGSTGNLLELQWQKMLDAAKMGLDYPLYREVCRYGQDKFIVEEWDKVETRKELIDIEKLAIETLEAKSLKGYKTALVKARKTRVTKSKPKSKPKVDSVGLLATGEAKASPLSNDLPNKKENHSVEPLTSDMLDDYPKVEVSSSQTSSTSKVPLLEVEELTAYDTVMDELEGLLELQHYTSQESIEANPIQEIGIEVLKNQQQSKSIICEFNSKLMAAAEKQKQINQQRCTKMIELEKNKLSKLLEKIELLAQNEENLS